MFLISRFISTITVVFSACLFVTSNVFGQCDGCTYETSYQTSGFQGQCVPCTYPDCIYDITPYQRQTITVPEGCLGDLVIYPIVIYTCELVAAGGMCTPTEECQVYDDLVINYIQRQCAPCIDPKP